MMPRFDETPEIPLDEVNYANIGLCYGWKKATQRLVSGNLTCCISKVQENFVTLDETVSSLRRAHSEESLSTIRTHTVYLIQEHGRLSYQATCEPACPVRTRRGA